jgi:hypothetical protein
MSPVMKMYINKLRYPKLIKDGIASFSAEIIFGDKYKEICQELYINSLKKLAQSPNSMHKYGSEDILSILYYNTILMNISPFIYEYFNLNLTSKLILYKDFTVHYGKKLDTKLDIHVDDSDITINICLKNNLNYTGLVFSGVTNTLFSVKNNNNIILVDTEEYDVIIHRGNHPHQVRELFELNDDLNKNRINLILWLKVR